MKFLLGFYTGGLLCSYYLIYIIKRGVINV